MAWLVDGGRTWLYFCHLLTLSWELPKLVAIKDLIMGVSCLLPYSTGTPLRDQRPMAFRLQQRDSSLSSLL
jgi:hypothetical protein